MDGPSMIFADEATTCIINWQQRALITPIFFDDLCCTKQGYPVVCGQEQKNEATRRIGQFWGCWLLSRYYPEKHRL